MLIWLIKFSSYLPIMQQPKKIPTFLQVSFINFLFNYLYKQSFYAITVEGILIVTVPPGSISPTLTIIFL
ncbi:MAG: hypothetical protein K0R54_6137, partial [Clostridiaceae bacterium]|nr:hypothetical protein [Clostridiaceae bacterium]